MRLREITEAWSEKYKRSIDCNNPKGFSQKAHCAGRKKNEELEFPISKSELKDQLIQGIQVEMEHTDDPRLALKIALDHLAEDPLYYDHLKFVENFADGKKKGKSRPGRVKRAGASCKGSVTSLRKKAKKYSGERAKMYHWCANMKAGRNK